MTLSRGPRTGEPALIDRCRTSSDGRKDGRTRRPGQGRRLAGDPRVRYESPVHLGRALIADDLPGDGDGIRVQGVSKRLGTTQALREARFAVPRGTICAVVGPNGSGKSTLLRVIAGLIRPDAGRVEVWGRPPGRGSASFVPPGDRGLHWRLTGRRNLEFFSRLSGHPRTDRERRVGALTEALGAGHLLGRSVGVCSSGERRRLAVACGFARGAPVVLLDEPTADLDPEGVRGLALLSRAFADAGGVILYATPSPEPGLPADLTLRISEGAIREAV